jgi:hypothetical protein
MRSTSAPEETRTVEALAALVDLRDGYTGGHSDRLVALAERLGQQLGLEGPELADLGVAARLHDIGKIGVPDSILLKRGSLNEAEQQIMRCHPAWGAETLERVPGLAAVATAVRHHHEQWNGGGYPAGLSGEDIPLASRIIFVCDAFAAMTSTRPYRRALDVRQAVRLLVAGAGTQFDPRVVGAMCEVLDEGGIDVPDGPVDETLAVEPMLTRQPQPNSGRLARAFDRLEALPALNESIAKAHAARTAQQVTTRAMTLLGDEALESPVDKWYRDAKIYDIFEGTGQIQRRIIAKSLLGVNPT